MQKSKSRKHSYVRVVYMIGQDLIEAVIHVDHYDDSIDYHIRQQAINYLSDFLTKENSTIGYRIISSNVISQINTYFNFLLA